MLRTLTVLALGTALFAVQPQAGRASIEVLNSGRDEHVSITAAGGPIALETWTLASGVGGQKLVFGRAIIPAGATIRVVSGATAPTPGDIQWTRQNVWNNDGDAALLFDPSGGLVAEFTYGRTRAPSPAKASSAKGTRARR